MGIFIAVSTAVSLLLLLTLYLETWFCRKDED